MSEQKPRMRSHLAAAGLAVRKDADLRGHQRIPFSMPGASHDRYCSSKASPSPCSRPARTAPAWRPPRRPAPAHERPILSVTRRSNTQGGLGLRVHSLGGRQWPSMLTDRRSTHKTHLGGGRPEDLVEGEGGAAAPGRRDLQPPLQGVTCRAQ